MSNTGYKDVLTKKGLNWVRRPWSGVSKKNGAIVLSVWDNLQLEESEVRFVNNRDVLRTIPGDWILENKGKIYMDHCHELKDNEIIAEVYFVRGDRWSNKRSEVKRCWVDPTKYYVRITEVKPDGSIEGEFLPWLTTS